MRWNLPPSERTIEFDYVNYKGALSHRKAVPVRFEFGTSPYHEGRQWFMVALDLEKCAERSFAMKDMTNVRELGAA